MGCNSAGLMLVPRRVFTFSKCWLPVMDNLEQTTIHCVKIRWNFIDPFGEYKELYAHKWKIG